MRSLSLLIKPVSGACDMRCGYCFYADVADNRAVKNYGVMTEELLETTVRKALAETRGHCLFAFQGGEPTLAGLGFYQKLLDFEKKYNVNKTRISHSLQTNGLALDARWAEFFRDNRFLVGLSVDGGKETHDRYRTDASGEGTHGRCMAAAKILADHGAEFNVLSVVTKQLAAHPDKAYRFYKRGGFRYIQFIPCLDGFEDGQDATVVSENNRSYCAENAAEARRFQLDSRIVFNRNDYNTYSLDAQTYGDFLCRVFDLWYSDFIKNEYVSIRMFDNYIQMLAGHPPENCAMNGVCGVYALVEADGSVYPCDFYAVDGYLLGNVSTHGFKEMLRGEQAEAFAAPSRRVNPVCVSCGYRLLCRGGCRRDREPVIGGEPRLNRFCAAYRQFFEHALPRLRMIAGRVRR